MKFDKTTITFQAGQHIARLFADELSPDLLFHNFYHTANVVRGARIIARHTDLSAEEQEVVELAAWFHDSGHTITYVGHELMSQQLAQEFLEEYDYPEEKTTQVLNCIRATIMPQNPTTLPEMVMCDADLFHLSIREYYHIQFQLREEWQRIFRKTYSDEEWMADNLAFLKHHRYFTNYGQNVLERRKQKNIRLCEMFLEVVASREPGAWNYL